MLILGSFFGKFSTEQHNKIHQTFLKVSDWRDCNGFETGFETDCTTSCVDKRKE